MARNINGNYFEDNYNKHECQSCRRSFIVGETFSENMPLTCPYCQSRRIELVASATEESTEDMDMGCLGIHFYRYDSGELMLHTEKEFTMAMSEAVKQSEGNGVPLHTVNDIITAYCAKRDNRRL